MNDARDALGTKLAVVLIAIHVIEEKDPCIFFFTLIGSDDVGAIQPKERHFRRNDAHIVPELLRQQLLIVPDHEALALDQNGDLLAMDELLLDRLRCQQLHEAFKFLKIARDAFDLRQRDHVQIHLHHVIRRFLII